MIRLIKTHRTIFTWVIRICWTVLVIFLTCTFLKYIYKDVAYGANRLNTNVLLRQSQILIIESPEDVQIPAWSCDFFLLENKQDNIIKIAEPKVSTSGIRCSYTYFLLVDNDQTFKPGSYKLIDGSAYLDFSRAENAKLTVVSTLDFITEDIWSAFIIIFALFIWAVVLAYI